MRVIQGKEKKKQLNEGSKETTPSRKNLSELRTFFHLAKEMGKGMGRGQVLQ